MISVVMKTFANSWERVQQLENSVESYLASDSRPGSLTVYDDCSEAAMYEKMKKAVDRIPGAIYVQWKERKYHHSASCFAMKDQFAHPDVEAVMILDADTKFSKVWWPVAQWAYEKFKAEKDFAGVTIFNITKRHPEFEVGYNFYVGKCSCGGFGLIVPRRFWEEVIAKTPWDKPSSWDHNIKWAINNPWRLFATRLSYLQHMGHLERPETIADNYVGDI